MDIIFNDLVNIQIDGMSRYYTLKAVKSLWSRKFIISTINHQEVKKL